jgi:hypothetical protein
MLLLMLACARSIPPELFATRPSGPTVPTPTPTEPGAWLDGLIAGDPLARRVRLDGVRDDAGYAAFVSVAERPGSGARQWWELESRQRGTLAVPFARGARLAMLEAARGRPEEMLDALVPLPAHTPRMEGRKPWVWLEAGTPLPSGSDNAALAVAERQVLLGWLAVRGVDVAPAAARVQEDRWARLRATPAGTLLVARGARARDEARRASGVAALGAATTLALLRAAADSDREQRALAEQGSARALRDRVRDNLATALADLGADAGSDESVGLALVALAAARWEDACPDAPCGGLDRGRDLADAGAWGPLPASYAAAWAAIGWKEVGDELRAAWDHPTSADAMVKVAELVLANAAEGLDRAVLVAEEPGPVVNLQLCRALGAGDLVGKDDVLRGIRAQQRAAVARALGAPGRDAAWREPLERIARRAEEKPPLP